MAVELRHLRYAVAAAHYGSFRRAANALGVKQSSLSRSIRQMEDRLGVAVFGRSSGGVRLTAAGAEILRTSRHLVEGLDGMMAAAKAAGRGEFGKLSVGFYTSISAGNLRASLVEFSSKYPEVEVNIVNESQTGLFARLERGTLDVAIVTGEPTGRDAKAMPLWSERIMVALPENHPLAANEVIYWTDLRGQIVLLSERDPGPAVQAILTTKFASPHERPKVSSHDAGRDAIMCLVGTNFGISLVFDSAMGANYTGVVYRETRDGHGQSRISYAAHWQEDNDNPALVHFLKQLEVRHPSPSSVL